MCLYVQNVYICKSGDIHSPVMAHRSHVRASPVYGLWPSVLSVGMRQFCVQQGKRSPVDLVSDIQNGKKKQQFQLNKAQSPAIEEAWLTMQHTAGQ